MADKDLRFPCNYGSRCFRKNPAHLERYKHPPKSKLRDEDTPYVAKKQKVDPRIECIEKDISESDADNESTSSEHESTSESYDEDEDECQKNVPKIEDGTVMLHYFLLNKKLIKNKFLFKMPRDFYRFWEVCKKLNKTNPCEAFSTVGLKLVGPYDILAGHFHRDDRQSSEYLLHWRYFHDPPELQTVIKGSDKTGYHLGYFRDTPTDMPVFMVENHACSDGILSIIGDNIFAAVSIYLEDQKASADPFSKMKINKFLSVLKNEAETCNFDLTKKSKRILDRYKRTVCKTFNKIGLVVPYEKKSQLGYRPLTLSDKELEQLFSKIQNATATDKPKLLAELQPTLTFANIAADEGDFGTGIELGWNIIAHGIEDLNMTASIYLASNYELLNKPEFAKIAVAHMANRKKGCNLSIL